MKLNYNQWVCLTGIEILDPDGWDRSKASSFLEDITLREFISRSMMSTLSGHGNMRLQELSRNAESIERALVNEQLNTDELHRIRLNYAKECAKTAELSDKLRVTEQARIGNFKSADQAIKKNAQLHSEITQLKKERDEARLKWQEIFDLVDGILKERDEAIEERDVLLKAIKGLVSSAADSIQTLAKFANDSR